MSRAARYTALGLASLGLLGSSLVASVPAYADHARRDSYREVDGRHCLDNRHHDECRSSTWLDSNVWNIRRHSGQKVVKLTVEVSFFQRRHDHNGRDEHHRRFDHNRRDEHGRNGEHNRRDEHGRNGEHNRRDEHGRNGEHGGNEHKNKCRDFNGTENTSTTSGFNGTEKKDRCSGRHGTDNSTTRHEHGTDNSTTRHEHATDNSTTKQQYPAENRTPRHEPKVTDTQTTNPGSDVTSTPNSGPNNGNASTSTDSSGSNNGNTTTSPGNVPDNASVNAGPKDKGQNNGNVSTDRTGSNNARVNSSPGNGPSSSSPNAATTCTRSDKHNAGVACNRGGNPSTTAGLGRTSSRGYSRMLDHGFRDDLGEVKFQFWDRHRDEWRTFAVETLDRDGEADITFKIRLRHHDEVFIRAVYSGVEDRIHGSKSNVIRID